MGDITESVARQGFKPNDPYPGGNYACDLDYLFPSKSVIRFGLRLSKVTAPNWDMTFADLSDDLEALYYASLWFEGEPLGVPEMTLEISRYKGGKTGSSTFLASKGNFFFAFAQEAHGTDKTS
ncbi:hypothetical protein ACLMJK_005210 [Lecanora helva]